MISFVDDSLETNKFNLKGAIEPLRNFETF